MIIKKAIYLICGMLLPFLTAGPLLGQSTWTGNVDSDWHNPNNWSPAGVPTSGTTVYIDPVGANPYPVITQDASADKLFISNSGTGGELTVANGSTLTLSRDFFIGDNGSLFIIENSTVVVGGGYTMGTTNSLIDITTGTFSIGSAVAITGTFNVGDGTADFQGDVNVSGSGVLDVDSGTVDAGGKFNITNSGTVNLGTGTLTVIDNMSFSGSGTMNAEDGTIYFYGKTFDNGNGGFNPGTSTFVFAGDKDQNLLGTTTFYDLIILNTGIVRLVNSDSDLTVLNDLTVEDTTTLVMNNNASLEVQGKINGNGTINSNKPYILSAATPKSTEVLVQFSHDITQATAENTANYAIDNGITVSGAVRDAADFSIVLLTVSSLTRDVVYTLTVNNIQNTGGSTINNNHKQKFTAVFPDAYYSRQSGPWSDVNSWSLSGHAGPPASSTPGGIYRDTVYIGTGHTVDVQGPITADSLVTLDVDGTGLLQVGSSGTLSLGEIVVTGTGAFAVNSGGTLKIGSTGGIAASGATGNVQTGSRTFSSGANYSYYGSTAQVTGTGLPTTVGDLDIDNTAGVTATSDLEVSGTLSLAEGILTISSGQNLIAANKNITSGSLRFLRTLSGGKGWRLLAPPVGSTYDDFLDSVVTQGYPGAYYDSAVAPNDTLQPSVLWYDETYPGTDNQRWRAPTAAGDALTAGRGLFVYVFGDVAADSRYNIPLPTTLSVSGQENEGSGGTVDLNVTYTAAADTGWNLVGNPFGATVDWDNASGWTKTNMSNTIYVWDANANGGNGDFLTWNGVTGSLGNGLIAPFQGFWVKANGASPVLSVNQSAKTTGGTYHGKEIPRNKVPESAPVISFTLSGGGMETSSYVMFSEEGTTAWDDYDGYRLLPYSETYLELYFVERDGSQLTINSMPRRFGIPIEVPLYTGAFVDGAGHSGEFSLSWSALENIPNAWTISLKDRLTGEEIDLRNQQALSFNLQMPKAKRAPTMSPGRSTMVKTKSLAKGDNARFVLRIEPGADAQGLPQEVRLFPNYPNPFNASTNIVFDLPLENRVSLEIYDILGRKVTTLIDNRLMSAGTHRPTWNAAGYATGVYIFRLTTDEKVFVKKMTHIK